MALTFQKDSLSPLYEEEFRFYIVARFLYTMALRMVATVVAYKLFQLTQTSLAIGLVGLSEFVPVFCLALYAGHVIDKSDKRTLLLKGMLSYSLCVAALVFITSTFFEKQLNTKILELCFYAVIFCTGVIRSFAGPTSNAIVSQLVPRNILQFAANISSSTFLIASIMGHASAGFFIAWFGVNTTFCIILCYVLMAAFMIAKISKKPIIQSEKTLAAWDSVKQGLHFVFSNKIMLGAISLDLFAVLFGGAVALIPEFASKILAMGPIGFGWLNAASDMGSMTVIVLLTLFPMRKQQGKRMMLAVAGFGACIIIFGLSNIYAISFAALVISGVCDGISVMVRGTIFQLTTPDEMRGRVSSVNSMFINSSNELGMMESGIASKIMGLVPSVIFGGSMTLLVVIITWFKAPKLRKMEY
jgi:MFS family permease